MKSNSLINIRIVVTALCAVGLAAGSLVRSAQADQWDKKTILTVNQPIQVTDTLLQPGQYVLKLADSNANRHIVQIFNGDQTQIINTVLAIPNYRLRPTGHIRFAFWETPPGSARALRAWFYPGDNFGQEFSYPKHLAMLTAPASVTTVLEQAPAPSVTEAPPQPQAMTPEPQPEKEPEELAQNNTPPPASEAAPQATPHDEPLPEKLPKTGSFYPAIGLTGLLFLGLYSTLRLIRLA